MNKRILSIVFTLFIFLLALTFNGKANAETQTVKYEYRLLGDYYEITDGIIEVIDPKGERVDIVGKDSVYLNWASGSYKFIYPSRTINVKAYEKMPEDDIVYAFSIKETYDSNESIVLPEAIITSTIKRTDGAPKLDNYQYTVYLYNGDEVVQSFNPKKGEMKYSFVKGGDYKIVYSYINCFGKEATKELSFKVNDVKKVSGEILDNYGVFDLLDVSSFYGMYLGETYPVDLSVVKPNGDTIELDSTTYSLTEIGNYKLIVKCMIDNEEIVKEFPFSVSTSIQTFITNMEQMKLLSTNDVLSSFITKECEMVSYKVSNGAEFVYNGILDLKDFDKTTSLIELWPNSVIEGNVSNITITLTDCYDPNNKLSVVYKINSDRVGLTQSYDNTLVSVQYSTVRSAFPNYGPLKDTAVLWDTTFYNYWCSPEYSITNHINSKGSFNISYDIKENKVYTYGNMSPQAGGLSQGLVGYDLYCLLDLNDQSLSEKFKGFRTGEVYLSVSVTGFGDVSITSIGGLTQDNIEKENYLNNKPFVINENEFIKGVIGVEYRLPDVIQSMMAKDKPNIELFDSNGNPVTVKGNTFTPTIGGEYTVKYSAINSFNSEYVKEIKFEIGETSVPILIDYDLSDEVVIGGSYMIKTPLISGGNGKIEYEISINDEKVKPGDFIKISDNTTIVITAIDQIGSKEVKEFELNVNMDYVDFSCDMPRAIITGKEFIIPVAEFYSYKTSSYLPYDVYIDDVIFDEDRFVVPSDKKNINIKYVSISDVREFNVLIVPDEYKNISDLFDIETETITTSLCTDITFNGNDTIKFPFELVPQAMFIDVYILQSDLTYGSLEYTLSNVFGKVIKIGLVGLDLDKPHLYINGSDTGKVVPRIQNIGNELAPLKYRGKTYYSYSIQYDDVYGIMVDNKPVYRIEKDLEGVLFNGFNSPIRLDIDVLDSNDDVTFGLRRIGNQLFIDAAFEFGDITDPISYSNGFAKQSIRNLGDKIDFSKWFSSDVLSGKSSIRLSFYTPDDLAIFENEDPKNLGVYEFIEIGLYRIIARCTDKFGNTINDTYSISIYDMVEPIIEIDSLDSLNVSLGEEVTLKYAKAYDNESNANITVLIACPDGRVTQIYLGIEVKDIKYKFNVSGTYTITYIAYDESGNYKTVKYRVNVR